MIRKIFLIFLCLMLFLSVPGCKKKLPTSPDIPDISGLPVIHHFTVTTSGASGSLSWKVTDAFRVEIDNGIGEVFSEGLRNIGPGETTTYTLMATNHIGQAQQSCTFIFCALVHCDIEVTMGIALSDATPFEGENGYMTFRTYAAGEAVGPQVISITHANPSTSCSGTIELELQSIFNDGSPMTRWGENANWRLLALNNAITSEFLANAQFQCWIELVSLSPGIRIEPQPDSTFQPSYTGWMLDESKAVYFTIIKE